MLQLSTHPQLLEYIFEHSRAQRGQVELSWYVVFHENESRGDGYISGGVYQTRINQYATL